MCCEKKKPLKILIWFALSILLTSRSLQTLNILESNAVAFQIIKRRMRETTLMISAKLILLQRTLFAVLSTLRFLSLANNKVLVRHLRKGKYFEEQRSRIHTHLNYPETGYEQDTITQPWGAAYRSLELPLTLCTE